MEGDREVVLAEVDSAGNGAAERKTGTPAEGPAAERTGCERGVYGPHGAAMRS